jgi:hypothetical protein
LLLAFAKRRAQMNKEEKGENPFLDGLKDYWGMIQR